jgi:MYXO-CTERM domain-containing protein
MTPTICAVAAQAVLRERVAMDNQIPPDGHGRDRHGNGSHAAGDVRAIDTVDLFTDDEARARSTAFAASVIAAFERIRRRRRY